MGLSSDILWHQTNLDGFNAIMRAKCFQCAYSIETISWQRNYSPPKYAFPMVCFSDIPLSDFHEYLGKYGEYTIGMRRSWGNRIGMSPVWYRDENSKSLAHQMKIFSKLVISGSNKISANDELLWEIIALTKIFQGDLIRRGKPTIKNYRFGDEHEVRYIPDLRNLLEQNISPLLIEKEYNKLRNKGKSHTFLDLYLPFSTQDVAMIICPRQPKVRIIEKIGKNNSTAIIFNHQVQRSILGLGKVEK